MSGSSVIGKSLPLAVSQAIQAAVGSSVTLRAPAKLNLRLKVEGRRDDGYHLLSMINCSLSLFDTLHFTFLNGDGAEVRIDPADAIPTGGENLVVKAFRAFWRAFGLESSPLGFSCVIEKRIPVGGGLGGGSADAGAVLRLLRETFGAALEEGFRLSNEEVAARISAAALSCGADVPYSLSGGLCWVRGIGEQVLRLEGASVSPSRVVIMVPPQPVPTALFYDRFRARYPEVVACKDEVARGFVERRGGQLAPLVENDFEDTAIQIAPVIGEGLAIAREVFPRGTALTGSGSVFFSLVPTEEEGKISEVTERLGRLGVVTYPASLILS